MFTSGWHCTQLLAATKGTSDKLVFALLVDREVERFQLIGNTLKVGINRFWADIMAHPDNIGTKVRLMGNWCKWQKDR